MRNFLIAAVFLASCSESRKGASTTTKDGVEKIKTVSTGKAFAAQDYLVPGYVTILDFYADW